MTASASVGCAWTVLKIPGAVVSSVVADRVKILHIRPAKIVHLDPALLNSHAGCFKPHILDVALNPDGHQADFAGELLLRLRGGDLHGDFLGSCHALRFRSRENVD